MEYKKYVNRKISSLNILSVLGLLVLTVILFTLFSDVTYADAFPPTFSNEFPQNNSYVAGGERLFQTSITDNELNTSTVKLRIISLDAYERSEPWDSYLMSCSNSTPSDWICNKSLSFAIVGSDTVELFYFEAEDTDGNYNSSGNETNPHIFTLDRNPPVVQFINPTNGSFVGGVVEISIDVTDSSSGVNRSTVEYSDDNSTWNNTTFADGYYVANWSTDSFSNNQTVTLYARAADNISNVGYDQIDVIIDNEVPKMLIVNPTGSGKVNGIISMILNVTEVYSGIGESAASYDVEGIKGTMSCSGTSENYTCQEYFDTTLLADGIHTFNFTVTDNAGNINSSSVQVNVDNTEISVSITNPTDGAFVGGNEVYVNATVSNADETVTGVKMQITGYNYELVENMNCSVDYKCYIVWNTTNVTEGMYTLTANVTNTENKDITDTISINLDKTAPRMTIDAPAESVVSGTIYPKVVVIDENGVNSNSITFNISTYGSTMECVMYLSGKKYVCSSYFNTTQLTDAYYDLYFYAQDSAGNLNSTSKRLLVDNVQDSGPTGDGGGETPATSPGGEPTTTTTAVAQTTTTKPTSTTVPTAPIMIVLGDIQNVIAPLKDAFKHWPVKVAAVVIVILLIAVAFFKNQLKLLLVRLKYEIVFGLEKIRIRPKREKVEERGEQTEEVEEE